MKSISGSVGVNGKNNSRDVMIVQYLLNCVPAVKGGPDAELAVDGMCGPLTCAAVGKFQKKQMGWGDGRVDPNGKTIASLNNFDPYPAYDPFSGPGKAAKSHGKHTSGGTGGGYSPKQGTGSGQENYPSKFGKQTGGNFGGPAGPKQGFGGGGQEDFPSKFGKQTGGNFGGPAGPKQGFGGGGQENFPSKSGKQGW